ncbi:MAG: tRNA lysidine(34) synthetase TilS [Gemmataceae bacterium]|nr:tRNA lysidine(34) synthetase TilS [Gemmataceae bacterium]
MQPPNPQPITLSKNPLSGREPGIEKGVLLAVSGGPDSTAMAHAMVHSPVLNKSSKWVLAHINHGLRQKESEADLEFVADLAEKLGKETGKQVLFESKSLAPGEIPETGLEAHARNIRYSWLDQTAHSLGISWVFTGHTRSDQAETLIMRMLRGAGWKGMRGIQAERKLGLTTGVFRPLLNFSRDQVLAYCQHYGLSFREDSSNRNNTFLRNRIRNHLLPSLSAEFGGNLEEALASLSRMAGIFYPREVELAGASLRALEKPRAGKQIVLDLEELKRINSRDFSAAMIALWTREGWPLDAIPRKRWEKLTSQITKSGYKEDLPGGIRLEVFSRTAVLTPA